MDKEENVVSDDGQVKENEVKVKQEEHVKMDTVKLEKKEEEGKAEKNTDRPPVKTYPLMVTDPDALDVYYEHCRIAKIENLEQLKACQTICLRNNLIKQIENLTPISQTLMELDLYDNQIEKIENLGSLVHLKSLDLSYNRIKKIENLSELKSLENLYLVNNRLQTIEGLDGLESLKYLELGDNQIRKIENLDALKNLKELYLGKNYLEHLENLRELKQLAILDVNSNYFESLGNELENLPQLDQFYASANKLKSLNGVQPCKMLTVLDAADNMITDIEAINDLVHLAELWLNKNEITWTETNHLKNLNKLSCIYLEMNPAASVDNYRFKLKLILPELRQIDATLCRL
ncbi:hypothetical protein SNEBB_004134 [Seison nebaliae]|nr:hypothetical protein SNEBB_004134 [Seison nebaliae]